MRWRAHVRNLVLWAPLLVVAVITGHMVSSWFGGIASVAAYALVAGSFIGGFRFAIARYWAPRRYRALVSAQITPDVGPPGDALPVAPELAQRWAQAITQRDWSAARGLVVDDFVVESSSSERPFSRRLYFRGLRIVTTAFPDLRVSVDEVVGRPAEPDIIWVRLTRVGRPRRGPALHITGWERWTLDDSRVRVRIVTAAGVTHMR